MTQDTQGVENRSEVVFVYDAERTNPNGNPMSSANEPRVDKKTGHAIVTDVRLKRYIRDQLDDKLGGEQHVYIRNTGDNDTREQLLEELFPSDLKERLRSDADELEQEIAQVRKQLLENAIDIRLFGATLSVGGGSNDDKLMQIIGDELSNFTGPVQFSPAQSLNAPVQFNEEYDSLTSVIATGEDKGGGGFDLDDKRLRYAVFPFHGIVNENAAQDTRLKKDDVEQLDSTMWRAVKNQTITRSKVGQEPRLYVRVEYSTDSFHIGDLHNMLSFGDGTPKVEELRSGYEVTLDVSELVSALEDHSHHIEKVHIKGSDVFDYQVEEAVGGFEETVISALCNAVGEDKVNQISVYNK